MDKSRQETAVEQAIDKLRNKVLPPRSNVALGIAIAINILEELRPVMQTQIEDAWQDGFDTGNYISTTTGGWNGDGEDYFTQTYGK